MADDKQREITEWYQLYGEAIFKYILVMIHDYQQAEDLTQDTFIKAHKYYNSFDRKASPKTWLFRIAHNVTVDFLRKQKPVHLLKELLFTKKDTKPLPAEILEVKENSQELYKALSSLKKPYKEVIILRKIRGFSIEETSEILKWSEGKVKMTLHRAIPVLEKQLRKEDTFHEEIR